MNCPKCGDITRKKMTGAVCLNDNCNWSTHNRYSIRIEDCDFSVRLQRFAKVVGAKTIDELRTKLESDEPVYIPGSLIASRGTQYFNKSRVLQELDAYQHHVLDRDPDHTL